MFYKLLMVFPPFEPLSSSYLVLTLTFEGINSIGTAFRNTCGNYTFKNKGIRCVTFVKWILQILLFLCKCQNPNEHVLNA